MLSSERLCLVEDAINHSRGDVENHYCSWWYRFGFAGPPNDVLD